MYTINTSHTKSEKCQTCQNSYLQFIGTQAWCINCTKSITMIQQEIKVVPRMYQSNTKNRQSSAEINILNYLNQFGSKFGGITDSQQLNFMYVQTLELRDKKGISTKNYRENAAVIVYCHFKQIHKLSTKQFCKRNQIKQKSFNKSYINYQKLLKQKINEKQLYFQHTQSTEVKKEQFLKAQYIHSIDQHSEQIQLQYYVQASDKCQDQSMHNQQLQQISELKVSFNHGQRARLQSPQHALNNQSATIEAIIIHNHNIKREAKTFINVMFDHFFMSTLYQHKKDAIVDQLSQKTIEIYHNFKKMIRQALLYSLEIFLNDSNFYKYLFYVVLKKMAHKTSQINYRKAVQSAMGESLRLNALRQIVKMFEGTQQRASSSGQQYFDLEISGTTGSQQIKYEQKD